MAAVATETTETTEDRPRWPARPRGPRPVAVVLLVLVVCGALAAAGCASVEASSRTFRGARLFVSGTEALNAGDLAQAVDELERAAALAPEASEIRNHLGLAYWASGDAQRARSAFEASLVLDCENAAARHNLTRLDAEDAPGPPGSAGPIGGAR